MFLYEREKESFIENVYPLFFKAKSLCPILPIKNTSDEICFQPNLKNIHSPKCQNWCDVKCFHVCFPMLFTCNAYVNGWLKIIHGHALPSPPNLASIIFTSNYLTLTCPQTWENAVTDYEHFLGMWKFSAFCFEFSLSFAP